MKTKIECRPRLKKALLIISVFISFSIGTSQVNWNSLADIHEKESERNVFIQGSHEEESDYSLYYSANLKSDDGIIEGNGKLKSDIQDIVSMDLEFPVKNFKKKMVEKGKYSLLFLN